MPKFPKKEADIAALAKQMIAGYGAHAGDFPSIIGPALAVKKRDFEAARDSQAQTQAAAQLATEEKLYRLNLLKEEIRNRLKKSAVDVSGDPEKLAYIGWGPRTEPHPVETPAAPRNLHSIAEGQGLLWLTWDKSASGGAVRNYIIERRDQQETGGQFGDWSIAGSALNNEINLNGQPRGIQMEYRVKAVNTTDQSGPSNIAAIVL